MSQQPLQRHHQRGLGDSQIYSTNNIAYDRDRGLDDEHALSDNNANMPNAQPIVAPVNNNADSDFAVYENGDNGIYNRRDETMGILLYQSIEVLLLIFTNR